MHLCLILYKVFPHPFVPDPLFEDAVAAERFVEAAAGGVRGGGGEDAYAEAPSSPSKSKKGARMFEC